MLPLVPYVLDVRREGEVKVRGDSLVQENQRGWNRLFPSPAGEVNRFDPACTLDLEVVDVENLYSGAGKLAAPAKALAERPRHRERGGQGAGAAPNSSCRSHREQHGAERRPGPLQLAGSQVDERTGASDDEGHARDETRTLEQRLRRAHGHDSGKRCSGYRTARSWAPVAAITTCAYMVSATPL